MKKIAIFINELGMGGIEKSVVNMINNLDESKYKIDLYIFGNKNFFDLPKKAKIIKLKKPSSLLKFIPYKIAYKLYNITNINENYDISIDFDSYQLHTSVASLKTKAKKHIIWIHNDIPIKLKEEPKYRILHFFFKSKYKYYDTFCAVSEGALQSFKKLYYDKNKNYHVIPNYINTNEIKEKMNEQVDLKPKKDTINIVTLGRLCHQKGIDIMLYNIKELTNYRKDFHLYIIGDGEERKKLEKLTDKLNLREKVTFLGSQKNPFKYLKLMDLFYLSSRYEGQGMVLLEALSVGLDVIIPKHLEQYCPLIKGNNNVVKYLSSYQKHPKNDFNDLNEYNNSITESLNNLFK